MDDCPSVGLHQQTKEPSQSLVHSLAFNRKNYTAPLTLNPPSFEITLRETGSNDLRHAYEVTFVFIPTSTVALIPIAQVIGGRVGPLNVREEVHFEPGSGMDEEDESQLYTVFLVMGEENEPIDAHGLSWNLQNSIHDTPERCEVWANRCVEVMKAVVAHGKPRQAIRDATVTMETGLLMRGELELCSVEALRGQG